MNYKSLTSKHDDLNPFNILNDNKMNQRNFEESQPSEAIDFLMNTLLSLENSVQPIFGLQTICKQIEGIHFPIDEFLSKCNAVEVIFSFLRNKDKELVNWSLITLSRIVFISSYTIYFLKFPENTEILCSFIEQKEYLDSIVSLLSAIIEKDNEFCWFIVSQFNFFGRIIELIQHVEEEKDFIPFLHLIYEIISKLTNEQLNTIVDGVRIISLPVPICQMYIESDNPIILIKVLQIFRVLLQNWNDRIGKLFPNEVIKRFVEILQSSKSFDEDAYLNIFNELIPFFKVLIIHIKHMENAENVIHSIIFNLIQQIFELPITTDLIFSLLGSVSKDSEISKMIVHYGFFTKIKDHYNSFTSKNKIRYLKTFWNSSIQCPDEVIEHCYKILDSLITESYYIVEEEISHQKYDNGKRFLQSLIKLLNCDRDIRKILDKEEFEEFLHICNESDYLFDDSNSILTYFFTEEEEMDLHGAFLD